MAFLPLVMAKVHVMVFEGLSKDWLPGISLQSPVQDHILRPTHSKNISGIKFFWILA